jgi:hypothetical protein
MFNSARAGFSFAPQVLCLMKHQSAAGLLYDSNSVTGGKLYDRRTARSRPSMTYRTASMIERQEARTATTRPPARMPLRVHTCTNAGNTRQKCHSVPLSEALNPTVTLRISRRKSFKNYQLASGYACHRCPAGIVPPVGPECQINDRCLYTNLEGRNQPGNGRQEARQGCLDAKG